VSALYLESLAAGEPGVAVPAAVGVERFPCVLGRHPRCDRRLNDPAVSRRHCAFSLREDRVWVEDLGSLNGTWLNGESLREARPLAEGDRLEVAHLCFRVRLGGPGEDAVDLGAATESGTDESTRRKLG
jgi:predicted component of type VI protein secretion system